MEIKMSKFRFQAHRGDSAYYPENTFSSYSAAIAQGYDIIELDARFTADNACICFHDANLNRTARYIADGSRIEEPFPVAKATMDDIRKLEVGSHKGEEFRGEPITTLAGALAYIAYCENSSIGIKLDNVLQSYRQDQLEIFEKIIKSSGIMPQIGFTCYTLPYLNYMAERFPKCELHYDGAVTAAALEACGRLSDAGRRVTIWVPYDNEATAWAKVRHADAEYCRELHQYGEVGIWLISEPEELRMARDVFGADVIETNGTLKPDR